MQVHVLIAVSDVLTLQAGVGSNNTVSTPLSLWCCRQPLGAANRGMVRDGDLHLLQRCLVEQRRVVPSPEVAGGGWDTAAHLLRAKHRDSWLRQTRAALTHHGRRDSGPAQRPVRRGGLPAASRTT